MRILGLIGNPRPVREDPCDPFEEWDTHWYHDASAVLLRDGSVVAALEEERLTRRKHDGRFPTGAVRFCLARENLTLTDMDCIAFGERGGEGYLLDPRISADAVAALLSEELGCPRDRIPDVRLVEHHLAHAMSAYGPSGFDDALVMTADGFGDGISGTVIDVVAGDLEVLARTSPGDSLGGYYSSTLEFLGYGRSDEYKVMGLAPYGDPAVLRAVFRRTYELRPEGRVTVRPGAMDREAFAAMLRPFGPPRKRGEPVLPFHQDVAAAVQASFEEMYLHTLHHFQGVTRQRNLCLAGGTAQNCSLTGTIARSGLFERVFVQPAAYDAGLALGAALFVQHEADRRRPPPMTHVFWGTPPPEAAEIGRTLAAWAPFVEFERAPDIQERTAEALASGDVVGWVQGRSEFGPRALGNRSLLADPRPAQNKVRVNEMVKKREEFRPFAPSVTEEDAGEYFDLPAGLTRSPFMTFVVRVKEAWRGRLAAITHVDGTARVQTVSRADNEAFWKLLKAFQGRTGVPVLLNTSFNNNVEPIVDSMDDALECFLTTAIDCLVVDDFVVRRPAGAPAPPTSLVAHLRTDAVILRGVERVGGTRGRPMWRIGKKLAQLPETALSGPAFRILSADNPDGRTALELARSFGVAPAQLPELGAELERLWSARLISLRPKGLGPPA
jgi:carbamoyltransferase